MTNRNSPPSMTRGIKKPRLRRVEIKFQGTPEPVHNGLRPHGGYRGMYRQRCFMHVKSLIRHIPTRNHIKFN